MSPDEKRTQSYLNKKGLIAEPFTKSEMRVGKTPDFRVFSNGEFQFFCEVKSSSEDEWLDNIAQKAPPGEIAEGYRQDPIFKRLSGDIHNAVKQFDSVNKGIVHPNVLALVNHDSACGFLDLLAVMTGNFYADDGSAHPIYWQFSEGRIKEEKRRIHLYIWLDDLKPNQLFFTQTDAAYNEKLCRLFNIDPKDIKQVGT